MESAARPGTYKRRLQIARFREDAVMENLELSTKRDLDSSQVLYLAQEAWIRQKLNVIITGPTGAGKTYLACALGNAACRNHFSIRYFQMSRLLQKVTLSQADGSYAKLLNSMAKAQLLIIDDWLRTPLTKSQTNDILEIIEDRYKLSSTILTTQVPVADWHERMAKPTLADAIMDGVVHNVYRLELKGESMRKRAHTPGIFLLIIGEPKPRQKRLWAVLMQPLKAIGYSMDSSPL